MQIVLLVVALSVDVFLASVACGTEHIKIQRRTALCISLICSGVLFLSLVAGNFLQGMIKETYATVLCFVGLLAIGIFKLVEYGIKKYIRKHKFLHKRIKITLSQLNFILSIYNNPVVADRDCSATMSVAEGVFFALAMSADGFFAGLGAAFLQIDIGFTILLNLILSFTAIQAGCMLGECAARRQERDLSWIGGVLFVCLAFSKIV